MVDMFALVVSLGMLAVVIFFAMRRDRDMPWFERPRPPGKAPVPRPEPSVPARRARPARFLGQR